MADPIFNIENAVEVKEEPVFNLNNAIEVPEQPSEPIFDLNNAVEVKEPEKTVFVEDRGQVIGFPDNYDAHEMKYSLDTDIDGKDKNNFFGMLEYGENAVKGLASFLARTPQDIGGLIKDAGENSFNQRQKDDSESKIYEKFILDPGELAGFIIRRTSEGLQIPERLKTAGQKLIDMNKDFINQLNLKPTENEGFKKMAFDLGSAVGSIGSSIGLTALTKKPELIAPLFGFIQKGGVYEEARSKGLSPEQASVASTQAGIIEGSLEFVGLHIFFNSIKASNRFARIALRTAEESVQEGSQQAGEEAITGIYGIRKDNAEDIVKRIGYAAALGAIAGGGISSVYSFAEKQGVVEDLVSDGKTQEQARNIIEKISNNQVKNGLIDEVATIVEKETSGLVATNEERKAGFDTLSQEINNLSNMADEKQTFNPINEDQKEGIYQKVFNRFQAIENVVDRAKQLGADIKPGKDAGLSANRYLSITNQVDNILSKGTYKITPEGNLEVTGEGLRPILTEFDASLKPSEPNDDTRNQDLDNYLIANRIIKDLQRPKSEDSSEFIVTPEQVKEAEKTIDELNAKYGNMTSFENAAQRIYDFQQRILGQLVDSGLMSQEKFDTIVSKNPHYVPFERVFQEEKTSVTPVSKNRFSGMRNPVKRIKGSKRQIHDPIETIIKNTYKIMDAVSRNKVFNDVYALKDIEELGIKPIKPDFRPVEVSAKETGNEDITIFRPSQFKPKGNVVEGFVNGERKYLEVSENLYQAMTGLDEKSSGMLLKILSYPSSALRVGATITPEFMLRNPIRDQWTALIQTEVGFLPFVDPIASIADVLGKSNIYDEWIRSGGSYAGFVELTRPGLAKSLNQMMGKKKLREKLNLISHLQDLSQLFEQATRVGIYKAALRKGLSPVEAARESTEGTLNFSRRGSQTKELNSVIAFFNAGIQSLDKSVRTIKKNPASFTAKAVATITIPSLLLYLINRNEEDYDEIPQWVKDLFWSIKINGTWYRVPKPFSYGQIFGSLPERFFEYLDKRDPIDFGEFSKAFLSAVSPIPDDPLSSLLPTAIKPLIENQTNWSFFRDANLVPEYKRKLIPSEQYGKYTSETSKLMGRIFNISPAQIDNLVSGYLGGTGNYALQGGDLLIERITNEKNPQAKRPMELTDIPLVKGFVVGDPVGNRSESVKDFYKNLKNLQAIDSTIKKLKKEGNRDRADKLAAKNPEYRLYKDFDRASDNLSDIDKKIEKIINSDLLDDSEKREKIFQLEKDKTDRAKRINNKLKGL